MEPTLILLIPVLALATGLVAVMRMPKSALGGKSRSSEIEARLEALADEVVQLRQELSEAQERIDFTERALAQVEHARRLSPAGEKPGA